MQALGTTLKQQRTIGYKNGKLLRLCVILVPGAGPRQKSQYNGADHEDRNHIAVAVLNINVNK